MKTIKIIGLNINRLISILQEKQVQLKNITRTKYDEVIIEISNKQYKKLLDLKTLSCYNVSVTKTTPTLPLLDRFVKRVGFFTGIIIALVILLSINSRVWSIEITIDGTKNEVLANKIYQSLTDNGVCIGSKLIYAPRELEKALLLQVDDISSVVVSRNGIRLEIAAKTQVKKTELSTEDIVSTYDGKITAIDYSSGILLVNVGEGVSKGQVLIASGKVGDFYGEAIGDIKAKVLISGFATGAETIEKYQRSGNYSTVCSYEFMGLQLSFNKLQQDISTIYEHYEVEKEEVFISKNNCLPIKKVLLKIYELEQKVETQSKEQLLENLKQQAYKTAQLSLPFGAEELSVSYDIFNDNGYYKVVCNIETEISIGVRGK